jgi:type I restriction enzyme S subunit
MNTATVVDDEADLTIFPDLFIRVPLQQMPLLPRFFEMTWNSPFVRDRINDQAKTTSGIWKVNQGHIASIRLPVPTVEEQRHIITRLDNLQMKVGKVRHLQSESSAELEAVMLSILDRAFRGEL